MNHPGAFCCREIFLIPMKEESHPILGGFLKKRMQKSALGELRCMTGGLQSVLLGFLRPQSIDITDFFEDCSLWSPMCHPYRIEKKLTESSTMDNLLSG